MPFDLPSGFWTEDIEREKLYELSKKVKSEDDAKWFFDQVVKRNMSLNDNDEKTAKIQEMNYIADYFNNIPDKGIGLIRQFMNGFGPIFSDINQEMEQDKKPPVASNIGSFGSINDRKSIRGRR